MVWKSRRLKEKKRERFDKIKNKLNIELNKIQMTERKKQDGI